MSSTNIFAQINRSIFSATEIIEEGYAEVQVAFELEGINVITTMDASFNYHFIAIDTYADHGQTVYFTANDEDLYTELVCALS